MLGWGVKPCALSRVYRKDGDDYYMDPARVGSISPKSKMAAAAGAIALKRVHKRLW